MKEPRTVSIIDTPRQGDTAVRPLFLGEYGERVFTLQFAPSGKIRGHIVYLPPFAEEMNRCRSAVADQARAFAARGFACTLLDFFGTGDSDGQLQDASLARWHDNVRLVVDHLQRESAAPLLLWGLRLGGLVALDFASRREYPVSDIILWQPVTGAAVFVNQMLRQRIAMLSMRGLPAEKTVEIRERLARGEQVEIAGYTVSGQLLEDLEAVDVAAMGSLCSGQIHWLEHVMDSDRDVGPAAARAIAVLESQGNSVAVHKFCGPQIWQVANRESAKELTDVTSGLFE
ncbi:MAG: hydrolase 2, exosortase A system-associated [Halioglobus sp.]|nr:hydrolase 2, exosortase A system-associated [Halioglobus sp.]